MNESRLQHLRRQQVLLREHLTWIEAEIARETGTPTEPATAPSPIIAGAPATSPDDRLKDDADLLIEQYAHEERQNPADIKRGCLLAFFAALALLIGGVTLLWLVRYR
jgi:hypothetical protein